MQHNKSTQQIHGHTCTHSVLKPLFNILMDFKNTSNLQNPKSETLNPKPETRDLNPKPGKKSDRRTECQETDRIFGNCNPRVTRSCNPRVTRSPGHVIHRSLYLWSVVERLSLRALLHWSVHELYTSTWHGAFSVVSDSRDTPQRCKEFTQVVTKPIIDKKRYFYLRRDDKIRRAMEFDLKTYCSIQSNGGGLLWQIT